MILNRMLFSRLSINPHSDSVAPDSLRSRFTAAEVLRPLPLPAGPLVVSRAKSDTSDRIISLLTASRCAAVDGFATLDVTQKWASRAATGANASSVWLDILAQHVALLTNSE